MIKSFKNISNLLSRIKNVCVHKIYNNSVFNLVGESTQAKNAWGASNRACKMGRAKAPVFPEPVCASPIKSFPAYNGHKFEHY